MAATRSQKFPGYRFHKSSAKEGIETCHSPTGKALSEGAKGKKKANPKGDKGGKHILNGVNPAWRIIAKGDGKCACDADMPQLLSLLVFLLVVREKRIRL